MIQRSLLSGPALLAMAGLAGVAVLAFALVGLDLSPGIILAILLVGVAIPFLVLRPDIGVQLFILTIFVENALYLEGGATMMKLAGGLILAGWLLGVAVDRQVNLKFGPMILLMLTFIAWNAVTILYALDPDRSVQPLLTYVQLAVAMCMVGSVLDNEEKVRRVLRAIVLCTTVAAVHGMALYFMGLRDTSAGIVWNRNSMATYLDIAIVCAYILFQMSPSAVERLWLLIALPTLFLGLALTFSRTGFIIVVVVFLMIAYRLAKVRGYIVLGATATMLVFISVLLPAAFYERVASIVPSMTQQQETFGTRVDLWKAGLGMINDHPITGVGLGNYSRALSRYGQGMMLTRYEVASHNTYVGIAAEAGIPALILYLLLCGAAMREAALAGRAAKHSPGDISLLALAVELCILVVLISGLSNNVERQKYLYVFFGLALCLRRLAQQLPSPEAARAAGREGVAEGTAALEAVRTT